MAERLFAVLIGVFEHINEKGQQILAGQCYGKRERRKGRAGTVHPTFEDVDHGRKSLDAGFRRTGRQ
jgi:hypothetical protein